MTFLSGRRPARFWPVLLLLFVAEYWWWHSRNRLWDGDALYYVAESLRLAGHSTADAIRQTGVFFHQETTADRIQGILTGVHGQSGAEEHNLQAPRFFYSLLAVPFVLVLGPKGVWVLSLLCGAAFLLVTMNLLARLFGDLPALAVLVVYLLASPFWIFQTGIYTEPLAALIMVLILTRLPIGRECTRRDLIWLGVLTVVLGFTRQSIPVPLLIVAAGWLWAAISTRKRRNEWSGPLAVVGGIGVAVMALVTVVFPFNEARHFSEVNHLGTLGYVRAHLGATFSKLPDVLFGPFTREWKYTMSWDHGLQVMLVLVVAALIMRWRSLYAALFLGAGLACAVLTVIDATGRTGLRYFVPCFPLAMMLIADYLKTLLEERGGVPATAKGPDPEAVESVEDAAAPAATTPASGIPTVQHGGVPA